MTDLAFHMFGSEGMGDIGLWMFLSIGAVALFVVFIPTVTWLENRRKEQEAFYKADTMRRITESSSEGAKAAIELMREEARMGQMKKREAMKIGGLTAMSIGLALLIFLHQLIPSESVYLCGLIPGLIGVAQLTYVFFLAPPIEKG